jgi:radical SAM protein with 4Fe4S-binding SPASM domain
VKREWGILKVMAFLKKISDYVDSFKKSLAGPSIIFEITPRCNLNCLHCYNVWKGPHDYPTGELSGDDVKLMLARLLGETGTRHMTFTGGEPLLRDDLEDIASFLHSNGVTMTVITNGVLMTEERARSLVASGITHFQVSVLGAEKSIHNRLVGKDAFDATIDGIANIRVAGGQVAGTYVATALNIDQWPQVIKLSLALGMDALSFNRFNPGGEGIKNMSELSITSKDVWIEALNIADNAVEQYGMEINVPIPMPPCVFDAKAFKHLRFGGCSAGTGSAYWTLDSLGNLRPCNHSSTILGNVREHSFKDITSRSTCLNWISKLPDECLDCQWLASCKGGCKASSEVCYGTMDRIEPFVSLIKENGV